MYGKSVIALLSLSFFSAAIFGQKKPPTAAETQANDRWYVTYIVWIKGMGGIAENTHSTAWSIDRTYGGWLTLRRSPGYASPGTRQAIANIPRGVPLSPEGIQAIETAKRQLARQQWTQVSDADHSNKRPVEVEINDEYEEVFEDRGGEGGVGACRSSFKKTWSYDGGAFTQAVAILSYDPEIKAAIMGFSIAPYERADNLTPVKYTYDRQSSGGFCGKSESLSKKLAFSSVAIPDIKATIQNSDARLILPESVLNMEQDTWEYTSPEFAATQDIDGFEDSKGNVTGKIWLKFSRKLPIQQPKTVGGDR